VSTNTRPLCAAIGLLIGLTGCTSPRLTLAFDTNKVPPPVSRNGFAEASSQKTSYVRLQLLTPRISAELLESPGFRVAIINGTNSPIPFSISDVSALSGSKPVKIYTPEEFCAELNAEFARGSLLANSEKISTGKRVFVESSALTKPSPGPREGDDNAADDQWSRRVPSNPRTPPGGVLSASSKAVEQRRNQLATLRGEELYHARHMLRPAIVQPRGFDSGVIRLRTQDIFPNLPLQIRINVAGEVHEFTFRVDSL